MSFLPKLLFALAGAGITVIGAGRYLSYSRRRRQRAIYPAPESLVIEPDESLVVVRLPGGRIDIRWHEDAGSVTVFAGTAPDAIGRSAPLATAEATDHLTLDDPYPGRRTYFEVVTGDQPPRITAERVLPVNGIVNMRDIGGYVTREGRTVRWGRVYRAGGIAPLDEVDMASLSHLGISLVCDLRSPEEVAADPDRLPQNPAPQYKQFPITAGEEDNRKRLRTLLLSPHNLRQLVIEAYTIHMIDQSAAVFGDVLHHLADPANLPAVVHCTAGKDRTGVTIALLLSLLGVADETIIADYSLSNRAYSHFQAYMRGKVRQPHGLLLGVNIDDFYPLLSADPAILQLTLDYLRQRYGSVESYLIDHAGLDEETLDRLRDNLLI